MLPRVPVAAPACGPNHCLPSHGSPPCTPAALNHVRVQNTVSGFPPGLSTAALSTCNTLPTSYLCIIRMVAVTEGPWVGDGVRREVRATASAF